MTAGLGRDNPRPLLVPPLGKKGSLYDTIDPMININPNQMIPMILNKHKATAVMGMTMSSLGDYMVPS
jgi:hypothetical protein